MFLGSTKEVDNDWKRNVEVSMQFLQILKDQKSVPEVIDKE